jgi:hypothetical protein
MITMNAVPALGEIQRLAPFLFMPILGIPFNVLAGLGIGAASLLGKLFGDRSRASQERKTIEDYKREKAAADRAQWEAARTHFEGPGGTRDLLSGVAKSMGLDLPISQMTYKPFSPDDPDAMTPRSPGVGSYIGQLLSGGSSLASTALIGNDLASQLAKLKEQLGKKGRDDDKGGGVPG